MPGFCGCVGDYTIDDAARARAAATLARRGGCVADGREAPGFRIDVAGLPGAPVRGPYVYEDDRIIGAFAGDVIDHASVPWPRISADTRSDSHDWVASWDGAFAVAVYDKVEGRLLLVGDPFACQPLFYRCDARGIRFGTNLPALLHLGAPPELDRTWFHQFMYFGYWPGQATFLAGARRVPPGSLVVYDLGSGRTEVRAYAERFTRREPLLSGTEALRHATDVFADRMPRYYGEHEPVEVPLSGGWDSRTVLAYMPPGREHYTYTYGAPGSNDRVEAAKVARELRVPHRAISFDEAYEPSLPSLMYEVVWLSNGLAWINRAMMPRVYAEVDRHRPRTPILMSGISLDTLFRGHNNARGDLDRFLATGETRFTQPEYALLFGAQPAPFYEDVAALGAALNREHGTLADSEGYLNYLTYTLLPSYFTADLEIGGYHATMRVPGWDRDIVRLAYEIEYSTLCLSKFLPHEQFTETLLQAHLMSTNRALARVPMQGMPLWVWTRENRLAYNFFRVLKHGPRYLKRRIFGTKAAPPLEDWDRWATGIIDGELRSILHPGCLVGDHMDRDALGTLLDSPRWAWRVRLASVELILQLMRNGWDLDALPYPGVRPAEERAPQPAR